MRKAVLGMLFLTLYFGASAAIYFACAGRTDLPLAWAYFGINLGVGVVFTIVLEIVSPGLIAERFKPGPGEQDRVFKFGSSTFTMVMLVVAGLDVGRYHWSGAVSPQVQIVALVSVFLGYRLDDVGYAHQPVLFFGCSVASGSRPGGHRLGPLPIRTSPGYTGAIPYLALGGLALGSWLAAVISGVPMLRFCCTGHFLRTKCCVRGFRVTRNTLRRVRYRLIPRIW